MENWPVSDDKWFTYYENVNGKKRLSRLEAFYDHHEGLKKVIEGKVGKAVGDLIEEEAVIYKEKINFKYPGGTGYTAHQDGPAGYFPYFCAYPCRCYDSRKQMLAVGGWGLESASLSSTRRERIYKGRNCAWIEMGSRDLWCRHCGHV